MVDLYCVFDGDWGLVSSSAGLDAAFCGVTPRSGRTIWEQVPALARSSVEDNLRRVVQEKVVRRFRWQLDASGPRYSALALPTRDGVAVSLTPELQSSGDSAPRSRPEL